MKLKYRGPFATVDVVGVGLVQRGEPFEVSDEIGESLLEQVDNYAEVKPPRKPRKPRDRSRKPAEVTTTPTPDQEA